MRRAGTKRQLWRTVRLADSSSKAKPEERASSTEVTLPSSQTWTRKTTTPCAPRRRATSGYGGLGLTPYSGRADIPPPPPWAEPPPAPAPVLLSLPPAPSPSFPAVLPPLRSESASLVTEPATRGRANVESCACVSADAAAALTAGDGFLAIGLGLARGRGGTASSDGVITGLLSGRGAAAPLPVS